MNISPNTGKPKITQPDRRAVGNFVKLAGTIEKFFREDDPKLAASAAKAEEAAADLQKAMAKPEK